MLRTLNPFVKKTNLSKYEKPRKPEVVVQPTYVYRDELNAAKKPPPPQNKIKKKVRFNLEEQKSEIEEAVKKPEVTGGGGGGVKVKILMTKEEAARLLSRCTDGRVLAFKDVANELVDIPSSRVAVVSCGVLASFYVL
nr:Nipped-B-like protein [Ipomoea batatas]